MITQSSACPAPATAADRLDSPLDPPLELLTLLADEVDELETPPRDCTVTDEPPGMFVDPDSPPGPAVTVLDWPHSTTRQSLLALPSRSAVDVTVEACDPLRPVVVVEDLLSTVAQGSLARGFGSAPNAVAEKSATTNAPLNTSARRDEKNTCLMVACLSIRPPCEGRTVSSISSVPASPVLEGNRRSYRDSAWKFFSWKTGRPNCWSCLYLRRCHWHLCLNRPNHYRLCCRRYRACSTFLLRCLQILQCCPPCPM